MRRLENRRAFFSDYGMLGVLFLLCLYFSWATFQEQHPEGESAAEIVAQKISGMLPQAAKVFIAAGTGAEDVAFAQHMQTRLREAGYNIIAVVQGDPATVRQSFQALADSGITLDAVATTQDFSHAITNLKLQFAGMSAVPVVIADSYHWPTFLRQENLINVVNQIVVILGAVL